MRNWGRQKQGDPSLWWPVIARNKQAITLDLRQAEGQSLLLELAAKVKQAGAANVLPLVGKPTDPSLPAADVDVAFMHDVLHHVEDRPAFLKQTVRYLKPGARFVVIELNPETSPHRADSRLVLDKTQVAALMKAVGFQEVEDVRMFDDKWFAIYQRK